VSLATIALPTTSTSFCLSTLKDIANGVSELSRRKASAGGKFREVLGALFQVLDLTGSDLCLHYTVEATPMRGSLTGIMLSDLRLEGSILDKSRMNIMTILDWPIFGQFGWLVRLVKSFLSRRRLHGTSCPSSWWASWGSTHNSSASCRAELQMLNQAMEEHIVGNRGRLEASMRVLSTAQPARPEPSSRLRRLMSEVDMFEAEERRRLTAIARCLLSLSDINDAIVGALPFEKQSVQAPLVETSLNMGSLTESLKPSELSGPTTITAPPGPPGSDPSSDAVTACAEPVGCCFQEWRFRTLKVRAGSTDVGVSFSELEFFGADGPIAMDVSASTDNSEAFGSEPFRAFDGNTDTSWANDNFIPLLFRFGSAVDATGFTFTTTSGNERRDPIGWKLEAKIEGSWMVVSEQTEDFPTPLSRREPTSMHSMQCLAAQMDRISRAGLSCLLMTIVGFIFVCL